MDRIEQLRREIERQNEQAFDLAWTQQTAAWLAMRFLIVRQQQKAKGESK
jgi:hypothetical protein